MSFNNLFWKFNELFINYIKYMIMMITVKPEYVNGRYSNEYVTKKTNGQIQKKYNFIIRLFL